MYKTNNNTNNTIIKGDESAIMPKVTNNSGRRIRPATTPEARENQMISLAMDAAEKQLLEGTASSQVITHFLKLATEKARLEREVLEVQKDLIVAKRETLQSQQRSEELYANAIKAFKHYAGQDDIEDDIL